MKKNLAFALCLTLLLSLFAGCNTGGQSSAPASEASAASASESAAPEAPKTETPAADLKANLRILYPGTSDLEKEVAADMQTIMAEKYPGVNLEFMFLAWADMETKLAVMVQSKDFPDAMQIQDVVNPVAMGALEPIEPYLGGELKIDMFSPVGLSHKTVDGTLYALPMSLIPYSHVANTDLFAAAGVKPEEMKNWTDVETAVKAMTKDGVSGYAMANGGEGRFTFRDIMMISLSNGFTPDDTSDATKGKYIEMLTFIKNMAPSMPKSQSTWLYPELFKAWEAGQTGMMHTGAYFTANVVAHGNNAMKFTQVVPMPAGPSATKPTMMVGSNGYAMFAGSEQKEATWKFIEVAFSEPVLGKLSGSLNVPAVNYLSDETLLKYAKIAYGDEVGEAHIKLVKQFQDAANQYGIPMPAILGQPAMEKVMQGAIVKLTSSDMTAEQAYDEIKKGIDEVKAQL